MQREEKEIDGVKWVIKSWQCHCSSWRRQTTAHTHTQTDNESIVCLFLVRWLFSLLCTNKEKKIKQQCDCNISEQSFLGFCHFTTPHTKMITEAPHTARLSLGDEAITYESNSSTNNNTNVSKVRAERKRLMATSQI